MSNSIRGIGLTRCGRPTSLRMLEREEFGGGDGLADVALGVVGDVNEEAAEGGQQGFLADGARLFEIGVGQGPDSGFSGGQCGVEFRK